MALLSSLLVAGAIALCAGPDAVSEPHCTAVTVAPAAMAGSSHDLLVGLAGASYLSRSVFTSDPGERWRPRGPGQRGDCEDRLLWVAAQLRQTSLRESYRYVALRDPIEGGRSRGRRVLHLILVIETDQGRFVIDTQHRNLRRWSVYAGREAYTPAVTLGGTWIPYS